MRGGDGRGEALIGAARGGDVSPYSPVVQVPLRRLARAAFLAVALALVVVALRRNGDQVLDALGRTGPAATAASLLAALVGLWASAQVWRSLLADLGSPLPQRAALHVFFLGQLGKYVPGNVFAIAAQMSLGRDRGVARSRIGTAGLLFMGVLVAAGLLVAAVALPFTSPQAVRDYRAVLLVLPLGLACLAPAVLTRLVALLLRLTRREPLERPLTTGGVGAAVGWAVAMWLAYGVHLLLLVRPQDELSGPSLPLLTTGGYALAWTAGFLFLVAPAGIGVREAALVLALSPVLDQPAALAVALLSRAVMTVGDVLWAGAGSLFGRPGPATVATVINDTDVSTS